jgi:hypothetical protein
MYQILDELLPPLSFTLKMEVASSFETLVPTWQTTWHHITQPPASEPQVSLIILQKLILHNKYAKQSEI